MPWVDYRFCVGCLGFRVYRLGFRGAKVWEDALKGTKGSYVVPHEPPSRYPTHKNRPIHHTRSSSAKTMVGQGAGFRLLVGCRTFGRIVARMQAGFR